MDFRRAKILASTLASSGAFFIILILLVNNFKSEEVHKRVRRGAEECDNGGVWNEEFEKCSCTLGWIGIRCNIWHNHYCYFDNGQNYRGKLSATNTGKSCMPWTTDGNRLFEIGENGIGVHNYCRNPDNDPKGLWCYVEGEEFTAYCNATKCPDAVKEFLSQNVSNFTPGDDSSAAVQFLFGPLISGVCAGVVALLGFIAIAEYARRKKFFARKKKREKKVEEKDEKQMEDEGNKKSREVRPLGGIVTVDVDTGEQKIQKFNSKNMSKARQLLQVEDLIANDTVLKALNDGEHRIYVHESPPPPYQPIGARCATSNKPSPAASPSASTVISTPMPSDISSIEIPVQSPESTHHRRKKRRKRRAIQPNLRSSSESDATLYVVEEKVLPKIYDVGKYHETENCGLETNENNTASPGDECKTNNTLSTVGNSSTPSHNVAPRKPKRRSKSQHLTVNSQLNRELSRDRNAVETGLNDKLEPTTFL